MDRPLPALLLLSLILLTGCRTDAAREKAGLVRVRVDESRLARAYQGERFALVIGVSHFSDSRWRPLRYTAKDAEDVARVLADTTRGGFRSVTVLTRPEQTTRESVLAALRALAAQATRPNDVVLGFWSLQLAAGYRF